MAMHTVNPSLPSVYDRFQNIKNIEKKANAKDKNLNKQKIKENNLCPFTVQWCFGINPQVPLINLTTENHILLAYACSHLVMIYNYNLRKMLPLQGHRNAVKALSTTRDGNWLLTADFEDDCTVVVWDVKKRTPVCTLFNPHGNNGMTAARISPDAKHIVTVGNEKCQNVHFWLWTYGKDTPDGSLFCFAYIS